MTTFSNLSNFTPKQVADIVFGQNNNQENKMTELAPQTYSRKTFDVEGVQVTEDNMDAVASWAGGQVLAHAADQDHPKAVFFVKVPVKRPLNDRQTRAFVGDWVLKAKTGFKVYTDKAMNGCFVPKAED